VRALSQGQGGPRSRAGRGARPGGELSGGRRSASASTQWPAGFGVGDGTGTISATGRVQPFSRRAAYSARRQAALAQLRQDTEIPLMADVRAFSPLAEAWQWPSIATRTSSPCTYPGKNRRRIGETVEIAHLAQAAGMDGSALQAATWSWAIGTAAMMHLAVRSAGWTAKRLPRRAIGPSYHEADLPDHDETARAKPGGGAGVPEGPGSVWAWSWTRHRSGAWRMRFGVRRFNAAFFLFCCFST